MSNPLKQAIIAEAHRLGFTLAAITSPQTPPHFSTYQDWLQMGRHASMQYLNTADAIQKRNDLRLILPECKSILVLALPYFDPKTAPVIEDSSPRGRVAAYAWGDDYHLVIPPRLKLIVEFIEARVGHPIPNRYYTDTGPILERDLAQRAGLGWIGKNTMLINPQLGSYFLLAEILLGIELEADSPIETDHCGTCTRCIDACPTQCILPDRTLDANRCISYLTIELKEEMPAELRDKLGNWVFGCDVCQTVCPWNRFAPEYGDSAFAPRQDVPTPLLVNEIKLSSETFNKKFKNSPLKRTKRRGYLRNVAVALGNSEAMLPDFEKTDEPLVQVHLDWAVKKIKSKRK